MLEVGGDRSLRVKQGQGEFPSWPSSLELGNELKQASTPCLTCPHPSMNIEWINYWLHALIYQRKFIHV